MYDWFTRPKLLAALAHWHRVKRYCVRRSSAARRARRCRDEFYAEIWREAAAKLGAAIRPDDTGILLVRRGRHAVRLCRNLTSLDSAETLALAGHKPRVHRLLGKNGIPTPPHTEFSLATLEPAVRFMVEAGTPCVVKPARDTGAGHGVTTGIADAASLGRAAALAASFGPSLLIEKQIPGVNYRLLYLDGVLLDAVARKPPTVAGDGSSTVRSLVHRLNEARAAHSAAELGQFLITMDFELNRTLAAQALDLDAVPRAGQVVTLKNVVNENGGGDNESATDSLADAVIATGARAAAVVGARLAGVDIITPDPAVPLGESGGVVCEINTTPGLYYHYRKAGEPTRVAVPILEALLSDTAVASEPTDPSEPIAPSRAPELATL